MEMLENTIVQPTVERLHRALKKDFESANPMLQPATVKEYLTAAKYLYDNLIGPVKSSLTEGSRLIIVPDDSLCKLPFEALLEKGEYNKTLNFDYLLRHHSVRYGYSATSLIEMENKQHHKKPVARFLGVAPVFPSNAKPPGRKSSEFELTPLSQNAAEVRNVLKIIKKNDSLKSDTLIGAVAVKRAFLTRADSYQIILLSTHAAMNGRINEYSFIAFSSSSAGNQADSLFLPEVETMTLNCDLLVLSACQTALGRWRVGEGIISLGRTFASAGVKSVVSTLWSVEEESTRELVESFFINLKGGLTKDKAIQQAKLDYLTSHKDSKGFPFYWAGFVLVGDDAPLWPDK